MHFYDFNIGDYAKKTQHLTNEEDLAYRRALDLYYDTEKPLPIKESGGLATLSRRLRVGIISLQNVVNEFFPDGVNKHADEKIAEYHAYLEKQSANGKRGGRPKTLEEKPTDNPPLCQNNPVPSQPLTTKPLPTNQIEPNTMSLPAMPKADQVPYQKIVDMYHDLLPKNPRVMDLTATRKGYIAARWKNQLPDLQTWKDFFEFVAQSDFLTGKTDPSPGYRRMNPNLEWLTKEANFIKIAERTYHGKV